MSGGRFQIEVFRGGRIMKPCECFEAAAQGKIEAYFGPPQWWIDKEPAIEEHTQHEGRSPLTWARPV